MASDDFENSHISTDLNIILEALDKEALSEMGFTRKSVSIIWNAILTWIASGRPPVHLHVESDAGTPVPVIPAAGGLEPDQTGASAPTPTDARTIVSDIMVCTIRVCDNQT